MGKIDRYLRITATAVIVAFAAPALADEPLKLSFNSKWPPYSEGQGDTSKGLLPALMTEIIEHRMGVPVRHYGSPWNRAQKLVENGQLDGFVTVATPKRLAYTLSSETVVYTFEIKPVVKKGGKAVGALAAGPTVDTLRKLRVCHDLGNGWGKRFTEKNDLKFVTASDLTACLRMIDKGRMDISLQAVAAASKVIRDMKLDDSLDIIDPAYGSMKFTLMLGNKSKFGADFLKRFDETVRAMKDDGSYIELIERLRGFKGDK